MFSGNNEPGVLSYQDNSTNPSTTVALNGIISRQFKSGGTVSGLYFIDSGNNFVVEAVEDGSSFAYALQVPGQSLVFTAGSNSTSSDPVSGGLNALLGSQPSIAVAGITHNDADFSLETGIPVTYTFTFSGDMDAATFTGVDLSNGGTATSIVFGSINEIVAGTFTVVVTPNSAGTLRLGIAAGADIRDGTGFGIDTAVAILDAAVDTITVTAVSDPCVPDADALTCPTGDTDGDGVINSADGFDNDPTQCRDLDGDACDDCTNTGADGSGGDIANDGDDFDGDGACDAGDTDDDNDGVLDNDDDFDLNTDACGDQDSDGCDDCAVTGATGSGRALDNDGLDTDGDGACNLGDNDDDNDGVADTADSNPLNANVCADSESDGCDDCGLTGADLSGGDSSNDGDDFDEDGLCDAGDLDDDNDGVLDGSDPAPTNPNICGVDVDDDACDDCTVTGASNPGGTPNNDGQDTDGDGLCDAGDDEDTDDDGVPNGNDDDANNASVCADDDNDGCDDCGVTAADSSGGSTTNDGTDTDADGACDDGDNDDDNDGVLDGGDADRTDANVCKDTDDDGCDDCAVAGANLSGGEPLNDGFDLDGDGACDIGDDDRDGDGLSNADEDTVTNTDDGDADSDDDGLLDGTETGVNSDGSSIAGAALTDPNDADSDEDGLCDGSQDVLPACQGGEDLDDDGVAEDNADPAQDESDPNDPCDPDDTVDACDSDEDGVPDGSDNCPFESNPDQADSDQPSDGGDVCDDDDDNDGTPDSTDADDADPCTPTADEPECDADGDGLNNGEEDLDGDGELDAGDVNGGETDANDSDTDNDQTSDGEEREAGADTLVSDPRDPCDPNALALACDGNGDGDDDGVPTATDPDDNDACNPTPNEPQCDADDDGVPTATDADDDDACNPTANEASCDADGDGLTNGEEDQDGDGQFDAGETDANDRDSDDDGVDDGAEVAGASDPLDPCVPNNDACDADGDGLSNGEEATLGTNEDDADTDDDELTDQAEVSGGSDALDPCDPDDTRGTCDPDGDGLDNERESALGTDGSDADSDGDGLDDGAEVNEIGSDPLNVDTDGDGRNDGEDRAVTGDSDGDGTIDVLDADDDGDGLRDNVSLSGGGALSCAHSDGEGSAPLAASLAVLFVLGAARRRLRSLRLLLPVAVVLLAGASQAATPEIPADSFRPTLDASGVIDVDSATVTGHLGADASLFSNYALNPLVLNTVRENGALRIGELVAHRLGANVVGSLGLSSWLQIGFDLPIALYQSRGELTAAAVGDIASSPLAVAGLGDLRLRPKVQLLRADSALADVALLPTVTMPTHSANGSFLGEAGFTFVPELAVSRVFGQLRVASNVGVRFRTQETSLGAVDLGNELTYRAGAAYRVAGLPLELMGSANGSASLDEPFAQSAETPLELLGAVGYWPAEWVKLTAGVGAGVINGYGVPDVRVLLGVQYARHDADKDGIFDGDDRCIDTPEDRDGFHDADGCPDADNDQDDILDSNDMCRNEAEDADGIADDDGCPEIENDRDSDNDGVLDSTDACVSQAGDARYQGCPPPDKDSDGVLDTDDQCPAAAGAAASKGCPDQDGDGVRDADDRCPTVAGMAMLAGCLDSDGDGMSDADDACPREPETKNGVTDEDGCPDTEKTRAGLRGNELIALDPVLFDSSQAIMKPLSFKILDEVAKVMSEHPELTKIEIVGHTDGDGDDAANQKLSEERAAAVLKYLLGKGIAAARLTSVGLGETRPLGPNVTEEQRALNRRVVFVVLEEQRAEP